MTQPHRFVPDDDGGCARCPLPKAHPTHAAPPLPVTPYDGGTSSGWSGSHTSRERAEHEDSTGVTSKRQRFVLALLTNAGARGATWRELAEAGGLHHGQASGPLSDLHKAGHIARLDERRDRSAVYVLPEHVGDRETSVHGGKRSDEEVKAMFAEMTRTDSIAAFRAATPAVAHVPALHVAQVLAQWVHYVNENPDRNRFEET